MYNDPQFPGLQYSDPIKTFHGDAFGTYTDPTGKLWTLPVVADPNSSLEAERYAYQIKAELAKGSTAVSVFQDGQESLSEKADEIEAWKARIDKLDNAFNLASTVAGWKGTLKAAAIKVGVVLGLVGLGVALWKVAK